MELIVPKMQLKFYEVIRMTGVAQPTIWTERIVAALFVVIVLVIMYATKCAISEKKTKLMNFSLTVTYRLVTQPRFKSKAAFLDGLKVVSWAQIVVFNVFRYGHPEELAESYSKRQRKGFETIIFGGAFAADTFFLISGLLLSYKFMEIRQKG